MAKLYDGQGKGDFAPRSDESGAPVNLGLVSRSRFGLAAEECAPVTREQARKDVRISPAEGPFQWRTAQYDQGAGPSGESDLPDSSGGAIQSWEDKAAPGVTKSGKESASKMDDE